MSRKKRMPDAESSAITVRGHNCYGWATPDGQWLQCGGWAHEEMAYEIFKGEHGDFFPGKTCMEIMDEKAFKTGSEYLEKRGWIRVVGHPATDGTRFQLSWVKEVTEPQMKVFQAIIQAFKADGNHAKARQLENQLIEFAQKAGTDE